MSLSALTIPAFQAAAEAETHGDPAVSPYLIGAIALSILLFLLFALVSFGGGREHS